MLSEQTSGRSSAGFKHFFTPRPLDTTALTIAGIGVHERMPPVFVRRPQGTGDYLLMAFHDEAFATATLDGLPATALPAETMMIWPPGAAQHYGHGRRAYSHSWIHCAGTDLKRWLRETRLPLATPFKLSDPVRFSQCLLALHDELVTHVSPDRVIAANLLENGLREIARRLAGDEATGAVPERLLTVRRWIGTAPARKITLDELAKMAGMSVPHFCACFKTAFGQAPIACLLAQRLNHAAYLLADKNLTITGIAERVGYDDPFHFSKAFKRHFGQSPRALRQERHGADSP